MTDHPAKQRSGKTGSLSRGQLEQALKKLYEDGIDTIAHQVRYMLALSQITDAHPVTTPHDEPPATIAQARLAALTRFSDVLNGKQVLKLYNEVDLIEDDAIRLPLVLDLALRLDHNDFQLVLRDTWEQANNINDRVLRSRTLIKLVPMISLIEDEPATPKDLLDVVALAQAIHNTEARVRSLVAIAPHLPHSVSARLLKRALDDIATSSNMTLRSNTISAMAAYLPKEIETQALDSAMAINTPIDRARALTAMAQNVSDPYQQRLNSAALDAIGAIKNEDERAAAFIAFVPHLDYPSRIDKEHFPILLEQALRIAITMPRRHIRARCLVALAPHLTGDLQGEALAAVHSLENEGERASLLAELAPTLQPDMLVASLAVAHTMREQDARVHALTILAHYVPENARAQTLLDALAAAANLPNHYERVTALINLVDILPPTLQEQAYTNALETSRLIENENARSRALSLLGQHLPQHLLSRALDATNQINDPQLRLNALIGIAPNLTGEAHDNALTVMLKSIRDMPFDYKRTRALVSIAPHLSGAMLQEATEIAELLEDPFDRTTAFIALAQSYSPETRPRLILQAWALIKEIDDGYDQASALSSIATYLPEGRKYDLARTAVSVIGSIMDEYDQASAITILASLLATGERKANSSLPSYYGSVREAILSAVQIRQQHWRVRLLIESLPAWIELKPEQQYTLWTEVSWQMSGLPLADVLLCLGTLTPILREMGGEKCLKEIAQILGVR
ncbi:MAG: hypothetical protein RLP44_26395 [Aggregatilineales bacterium]